ncbi:MAG: DUF2309 domain-containing protein [Sphingobacteriales bacterium]|nr:MAG: DUF2309 domain-containing protein [Sphingobacteriales bacterium]
MGNNHHVFDEHHVLEHLKHYLPSQAPLKDFIHHNTLHAFQQDKFFTALQTASEIFGYKTTLSISEYRNLYAQSKIKEHALESVIIQRKGIEHLSEWKSKLLDQDSLINYNGRIGQLRAKWRAYYNVKIDKTVQANIIRIISNYLDQGVALYNFPTHKEGLLNSVRAIENNNFLSFFKNKRAKSLLNEKDISINDLLKILVGKESLYEQYIFDQQFVHPGWSGMVAYIEDNPHTLFDDKIISLREFIILELLFEIDTLDSLLPENWKPLGDVIQENPTPLFDKVNYSEDFELISIWQEAFEWSYYDEVLNGIHFCMTSIEQETQHEKTSFQAIFCIDDRECSFRRHIEKLDKNAQTFASPGFFGVEFYYQPINGKFYTKLCPAPLNPEYIIKEVGNGKKVKKDLHYNKNSHTLLKGWLISQSLGFSSALNLAINIFSPRMTPATTSSFKHIDIDAELIIENKEEYAKEDGRQLGFKVEEMATRVENLFRSIGLIENFADIVYFVGHGATSINNTHYAGYDCGACSGRPGSVNSKVIAYMANHPKVRAILKEKGLQIPDTTQFVAALHDTTRDEIAFYDVQNLNENNVKLHESNKATFHEALKHNAKERSRRFDTTHSHLPLDKVYNNVKKRSVSLFEPRPELNHATNTLCIVGRRQLTKNLFLDRRAFMNSYDYRLDPEGKYLFGILNAAAPVCGGINLEYYFSRVDNYKLGAGTKLPHNVMGLIGVANGINGDLRTGLPSQMIELHDPLRLMIIVEHFPDVVMKTILSKEQTYEWFKNEWIHLVVVNPENKKLYKFQDEAFVEYQPTFHALPILKDEEKLYENHSENLPIFLIK